MDRAVSSLTVFFDGTFWVGVFERIEEGRLSAAKVTFGTEPRERDVYAFILRDHHHLRFSPAVKAGQKKKACNSKRIQRKIREQMQETSIGTKAQQALKMRQEQMKTQRKVKSREQREAEKEKKFASRQQKRKEKHRGR